MHLGHNWPGPYPSRSANGLAAHNKNRGTLRPCPSCGSDQNSGDRRSRVVRKRGREHAGELGSLRNGEEGLPKEVVPWWHFLGGVAHQ
jgi:hypothetical protein